MIPSFGVPQPLMSRWVVTITFDTVRERFICILVGGRRGREGGGGGGGGDLHVHDAYM